MNKDISKKVFFVTGGGTGGHIYPAVSVINTLLAKGAKDKNIFYIGNKKNQEYKIATENGFNFLNVNVFGMPRKFSPKFLKWLFCLFVSILTSLYYFLKYKPSVVFGTGGYVSAPALFAAKFLKVPYVLHDSDCFPGIVTRKFACGAKAVNLAFEDAAKHLNTKNIYHFKNPVRKRFFELSKTETRSELGVNKEFLILIMGGSQGAKSINEAALEFIKNNGDNKDIKVILQTGRKNYDEIVNSFKIPENARIEPYFDDMASVIVASDLIVSRAGSISISEILSAKTPAILVPYPYAAADHQRINAKSVVDKNAAIYLEDKDLNKLTETITALLNDKEKYALLKENAALLGAGFEKGSEMIANLIIEASK